MRFKTEDTSLGSFFVKEARVSDDAGLNLYAEYCNAKRASVLLHPTYGAIAPPPIGYTGDAIRFKNLAGYKTAVPSLFFKDNRVRDNAIELIEKIGSILAFIHSSDSDYLSQTEFPSSFPLPIDRYLDLNPAVLNLLKDLSSQTHTAINDLRESISSRSSSHCHIHGDFKPDNILFHGSEIQIVDWELAGQGVPEHDFASFYAGIFTELVHRAVQPSIYSKEGTARNQLTSAVNSSILCTRWLISSYNKVGKPLLDISLLTQLIGAKLLARTAMHSYINAGASPFMRILQQAAENCLCRPFSLSHLLSQPAHGKNTNALF